MENKHERCVNIYYKLEYFIKIFMTINIYKYISI